MYEKISQFDWPTGDTSCHGKQISVHTRELAPETDSCNRFAPGACSLISNQFDTREQISGAKVLMNIFSLEIAGADEGALLREGVAGACCGSKLPRLKGHLTPFCGCATNLFDFLSNRTFFKLDICERNPFPSIDLTRRVKIVILILKNFLVNHNRFKRHILCFELKTVKKYDALEKGFSKQLETKATWRTKIGNFI